MPARTTGGSLPPRRSCDGSGMSIIPVGTVDLALDIPEGTVLVAARQMEVTVESPVGRGVTVVLQAGTRLRVLGCEHWMVCGTSIECADIECTIVDGPRIGQVVRFIVGAGMDTDLLESARSAGVGLAEARPLPLWPDHPEDAPTQP